MLPEVNDKAGWIAGAVLAVAGLWKAYLKVRGDRRIERGDDAAEHGYALTISTLEKTVERLDALVSVLNHRLDVMGKRLEEEMDAHRQARHTARDAEQTAVALRHRVAMLEQEVRELKLARGAAGDMP